jgi:ribosomal protein L37AE/L43A
MERQTPEDRRAQAVCLKFDYLNHLVYLSSGASAAIALLLGLMCNNLGMAIAGVSTAGIPLYFLSTSRDRAAQTAATLLINSETEWKDRLTALESEREIQITALDAEREILLSDRLSLSQELAAAQSRAKASQQQLEELWEPYRKLQATLEQTQDQLLEKRHGLAIHLEAIAGQIFDIWNPLYGGLIAICDRFDPTRPAPDLEYAGKPVTLEETERRQWKHYRDSLTTYDARLRERINSMSDDCETQDEAYGFFLRLLEEVTLNYCKLWANIKDLELLTVHEAEKRAIYSEFENFRSDYASEASHWLEASTKIEEGFTCIEESFKTELANLQQRIVEAEHLIDHLQAPRQFRGETSIDQAGNRIIEHFASSGVIVDAIESVKIPGGFQLRFKVDRNPDSTRLAESEFDKHCEHLGLWGLSQRPLDFELDTRNFLLSVKLFTIPDGKSRSSMSEGNRSAIASKGTECLTSESIADRFQELDCYNAFEFEDVVRLKFVPRVRVVAGSTGGKSPLLELIACGIAQIHKGEIWLINPIPGSPKDWFHVPGMVAPGVDGMELAIACLKSAHNEFITRRNDLPGTTQKPFITVVVDEINAIAREFAGLGTVMKDFYQLSDHTRMGFLTAGQGGNVSGVSGGFQANRKTGNASKLMEEDFQNATQVFTAAAARSWIEKHLKGSQMNTYLDQLTELNQLCAELNQLEGKSAYPTDPTVKKVSPDAYRIALVVSPKESNPFFMQLPPYSSYVGRLEGVTYPDGARVTAPIENQLALGVLNDEKPSKSCPHCGHDGFRRKGSYVSGLPRWICRKCSRTFPLSET